MEDSPLRFLKFPDFLWNYLKKNTVSLSRIVQKQDETEKIVVVFSTSPYSLGWGKAYCLLSSLYTQQPIFVFYIYY